MKIEVSEWHIKTGQRGSCRLCPVANAITARLPAGHYAEADAGLICVYDAAKQLLWSQEMPQSVKDFVCEFDKETGEPNPFEFELGLK